MASISSVTVEVTPVLPDNLQAQVETAVREAVAAALHSFADSLTAPATNAAEPRFQYRQINGREGIVDTERNLWNDYGPISSDSEAAKIDKRYVEDEATELNEELAAGNLVDTDLDDWDPIPSA